MRKPPQKEKPRANGAGKSCKADNKPKSNRIKTDLNDTLDAQLEWEKLRASVIGMQDCYAQLEANAKSLGELI